MNIKVWESEQDQQAYKALQKWAERLNQWEYATQVKRNKGKKLKQFSPNSFSLILLDACRGLLDGTRTAEEAISLLHTVEGRTETRLCMEYRALVRERGRVFLPIAKKKSLEGINMSKYKIFSFPDKPYNFGYIVEAASVDECFLKYRAFYGYFSAVQPI